MLPGSCSHASVIPRIGGRLLQPGSIHWRQILGPNRDPLRPVQQNCVEQIAFIFRHLFVRLAASAVLHFLFSLD